MKKIVTITPIFVFFLILHLVILGKDVLHPWERKQDPIKVRFVGSFQ